MPVDGTARDATGRMHSNIAGNAGTDMLRLRGLLPALAVALLVLATAGGSDTAGAQTADAGLRPAAPSRPRVGLVLAGGGAKGGAHVGVLKVLEQMHVPVDCIAGTSMGALVGGTLQR